MKHELPRDFRHEADAVAIGASAGGIDALLMLLQGLGGRRHAPVIVVLHLPDDHESRLAELFAARLGVAAEEAVPGAPVAPDRVYFAPAGYHLQVEGDATFSLSCDPPVLFSRPSIDVLLETCADAYAGRLAAMVLTGANEDGARGLARVRAAGGLTAAQDPADAAHGTMPLAAVRIAQPDYVLPLAGLRTLLHTVACR